MDNLSGIKNKDNPEDKKGENIADLKNEGQKQKQLVFFYRIKKWCCTKKNEE